ncbi:general secretion pathway protein K [Ectothiorhodospira magna]|uniref:General secretion pathway protein K n=1 Tax=Ectothiorhodospira magna TaxID=867345 RepID=A0A1H9BIV1_9GAMM|nr:type II secretion system protein GspK [Ectothiorhodospira magna]SEP88835.1 general secretion pathway protein K [Ectothiorhodospira magna]
MACLSSPRPHRGLALLAVLWITAALSVLVAGMVYQVRGETQMARMQLERATIQPLMAGALRMAARDLPARPEAGSRAVTLVYRIGDHHLTVEAIPLNGFISLSSAGESLLVDMFVYGARLDPDGARLLAQTLVAHRQTLPEGFVSRRQLHDIPGMERDIYDSIAPLVVPQRVTGGQINPEAAPAPVLRVLARGDDAVVQRILETRRNPDGQWRTDGLETRHLLASRARAWVVHVEYHQANWRWRQGQIHAPAGLPGGRHWQLLDPLHRIQAHSSITALSSVPCCNPSNKV